MARIIVADARDIAYLNLESAEIMPAANFGYLSQGNTARPKLLYSLNYYALYNYWRCVILLIYYRRQLRHAHIIDLHYGWYFDILIYWLIWLFRPQKACHVTLLLNAFYYTDNTLGWCFDDIYSWHKYNTGCNWLCFCRAYFIISICLSQVSFDAWYFSWLSFGGVESLWYDFHFSILEKGFHIKAPCHTCYSDNTGNTYIYF